MTRMIVKCGEAYVVADIVKTFATIKEAVEFDGNAELHGEALDDFLGSMEDDE